MECVLCIFVLVFCFVIRVSVWVECFFILFKDVFFGECWDFVYLFGLFMVEFLVLLEKKEKKVVGDRKVNDKVVVIDKSW